MSYESPLALQLQSLDLLVAEQQQHEEQDLGLWSSYAPSEGEVVTDCQYDDWGYPLDEEQHETYMAHLAGQPGLLSYFDSMSEFDSDDYEYQQGLLY